jgi:hypothetical protein
MYTPQKLGHVAILCLQRLVEAAAHKFSTVSALEHLLGIIPIGSAFEYIH